MCLLRGARGGAKGPPRIGLPYLHTGTEHGEGMRPPRGLEQGPAERGSEVRGLVTGHVGQRVGPAAGRAQTLSTIGQLTARTS